MADERYPSLAISTDTDMAVIPNPLLTGLITKHLSGLQKGALLRLLRLTYGAARSEVQVSLVQWALGLDASVNTISATLAELTARNIIHRRQTRAWGPYSYRLNPDVETWQTTKPPAHTQHKGEHGVVAKNHRNLTEPRRSHQYTQWRTVAYRLRCSICGVSPFDSTSDPLNPPMLHVHHRLTFAEHPESRFDPSNAIVLCADCHRAVHSGLLQCPQ